MRKCSFYLSASPWRGQDLFIKTRQERFQKILDYFQYNDLPAETELHYKNPFQLLVAVILSAQCTDKRVNLITPKLFADYPNAEALAASTPETIFNYIRRENINHITEWSQ